jgi:hypothetical protein
MVQPTVGVTALIAKQWQRAVRHRDSIDPMEPGDWQKYTPAKLRMGDDAFGGSCRRGRRE